MDWRNSNKNFIENVEGGYSQEHFILAFFSGSTPFVHILNTHHFKRFTQYCLYQLKEYEQEFGTINVDEWKPSIKSPFLGEPPNRK